MEAASPARSATAAHSPGAEFPLTRWSEVALAASADQGHGEPALNALVARYWRPLETHLQRKFQCSREQSQDWLQGFLHERVVRHRLIHHAQRRRGRFRTFLLNALDNYVISEIRRARAQKRRPAEGLESLEDVPESLLPAQPPEVDDLFHVDWAREVVAETLKRLETDCQANGQSARWQVFKARVLDPLLEGKARPPYEELVQRFGFPSPATAYHSLTTALRAFRRLLHQVVQEYDQDPDLGEDAVEELRSTLARLGAASSFELAAETGRGGRKERWNMRKTRKG